MVVQKSRIFYGYIFFNDIPIWEHLAFMSQVSYELSKETVLSHSLENKKIHQYMYVSP